MARLPVCDCLAHSILNLNTIVLRIVTNSVWPYTDFIFAHFWQQCSETRYRDANKRLVRMYSIYKYSYCTYYDSNLETFNNIVKITIILFYFSRYKMFGFRTIPQPYLVHLRLPITAMVSAVLKRSLKLKLLVKLNFLLAAYNKRIFHS